MALCMATDMIADMICGDRGKLPIFFRHTAWCKNACNNSHSLCSGPPPPMYAAPPMDMGMPGPGHGPPGPMFGPGMGRPDMPPPFNPQDIPREPNIVQEIVIARRFVGKIIGPGGETAASIRRQAKCGFHVRKENRPDETQIVEISGNPNQVGHVHVWAGPMLHHVFVCCAHG